MADTLLFPCQQLSCYTLYLFVCCTKRRRERNEKAASIGCKRTRGVTETAPEPKHNTTTEKTKRVENTRTRSHTHIHTHLQRETQQTKLERERECTSGVVCKRDGEKDRGGGCDNRHGLPQCYPRAMTKTLTLTSNPTRPKAPSATHPRARPRASRCPPAS